MSAKNIIKDLVRESQAAIGTLPLIARDVRLPKAEFKVLTVTGIRRCGKSSLLRMDMAAELAAGTARERMFFINLEDERLDAETATLTAIPEAYQELYPGIALDQVRMYLDEIQIMPRWEQFVVRMSEMEKAVVRISGSNSKLLSREIATTLRGRTLNTPLLPFSLAERLRLRGLVLDPYLPRERARLKAEVRDHLLWGGFPEVITLPRPDKRPQLDEYFNVLLFRDLIERHGILQPVVVKHFLKRMLASATKPVSVSKVDQMLRSAGIRTTKALLYDWLDHALDTHLLIRCDRFGASATERLTSTTRFFCTDNGLLTAVTGSFKDEWGKLLENATAVEAVRQGWGISYYKEKRECDLVLSANGRPMRRAGVLEHTGPRNTPTRTGGSRGSLRRLRRQGRHRGDLRGARGHQGGQTACAGGAVLGGGRGAEEIVAGTAPTGTRPRNGCRGDRAADTFGRLSS